MTVLMNQQTLVVMVGLPRSGKSTLAQQYEGPIVCPDEIRLALHGETYLGKMEAFVWPIARVMVRALFGAGHEQVILDATNVFRERRDFWKARPHHGERWIRKFHEVDTPVDVCKRRALEWGATELLDVIDRMAAKYEPLEAGEHLDVAERLAKA